jgi:hypothetical protein
VHYRAGIEAVIKASWRERITREIRDRHDNAEHGFKTKRECIHYFVTGPNPYTLLFFALFVFFVVQRTP